MRHRTERLRLVLALALVFATASMGLLVSAPSSRADHDTIGWSAPVHVAGASGFSDNYPVVVPDGRGFVYVFYVTTRIASSTSNINVTKYAAVGPGGFPQFQSDQQVNSIANVVDAGLPFAATVDHAGNLYVAWTRVGPSSDQIWVSKSSDSGVSWQAAVQVSGSATNDFNFWPAIATTPDGAVYVAWVQTWGSLYAATVARSTDGGSTFSAPLNVTSVPYVWSLSIAADSSGRVYLAWGGVPTVSSSLSVLASWSDTGSSWSAPVTFTTAVYPGFFPALYADTAGTVHLSWFSQTGSDYAIRYSRTHDRGVTWTSAIPTIPPGYGGGYIGYMAGEGDTVMYAYSTYANSVAFAVSGDHGASWYPSDTFSIGTASVFSLRADQNDTVWGAYTSSNSIYMVSWAGPPSAPVVASVIPSGSNGLTVSWNPSPEQNVQEYRIYRSADGSTYQIIAVVPKGSTSYTDAGLANGTYWYKVDAINGDGVASHVSGAWSGVVGPTTAELIANLESEIASLQAQLAEANASSAAAIAAAQAQIAALRAQLTSLQNSEAASNTATAAQIAQLQADLTNLQNQLNNLQAQQATQTISYANLAFEVIVVVLLVVLLLNQMRKPKSPQMMMAQPGQAAPSKPEDDL